MEIGDEILIRAKVVDFDTNPHGAAVKVEVMGFIDRSVENQPFQEPLRFWIHRLSEQQVIVKKKP